MSSPERLFDFLRFLENAKSETSLKIFFKQKTATSGGASASNPEDVRNNKFVGERCEIFPFFQKIYGIILSSVEDSGVHLCSKNHSFY